MICLHPRWTINCLYVGTARSACGFKINKQGGVSLSRGKHQGSWASTWKSAKKVAGWVAPWMHTYVVQYVSILQDPDSITF